MESKNAWKKPNAAWERTGVAGEENHFADKCALGKKNDFGKGEAREKRS